MSGFHQLKLVANAGRLKAGRGRWALVPIPVQQYPIQKPAWPTMESGRRFRPDFFRPGWA